MDTRRVVNAPHVLDAPPVMRASKTAVPLPRRVAEKRTSRAATEQEAA